MPAASPQDLVAVTRLSTETLPERERLATWRELYGREILRLENEPLSDLPFHVTMALRKFPGLGMVSANLPPLRVGRTRELISDGNDAVTFQISSTDGLAVQRGREVKVAAGQAIGLPNAEVGSFNFPSSSQVLALGLSRQKLYDLVPNLEDMLVRAVPNDVEALWLLKHYVGIFDNAPKLASAELLHVAVTHVYDLAAIAFGATREASEMAQGRGMRAARLSAAKAFVRQHAHQYELRARTVAAHLGVTPRYVHMLFEEEGQSLMKFVLAERLARANRMLRADSNRNVSAIAFAAGFGDLSYFNRTFRSRFGCTPTDVRAEARQASAGA